VARATAAPARNSVRRSIANLVFSSVDMFTPAFDMAPPSARTTRRAHFVQSYCCKKADFSGAIRTQSNAQMMRCDRVIVNEMEFRMLRARKGLSPRSQRRTMKRFRHDAIVGSLCAAASRAGI
jgi:hypothetical protein